LDVACGPGYVAAQAAERGAQATGIDFSAAMVEEARKRFPAVEYIEGDATKLGFRDSTFDAVVSNFGMLHLAEPEQGLKQAHRVLKSGGRISFTVWDTAAKAVAHGIVLRAIQAHGDPNVSIPAGPPFFRFSDPTEAKRTLTAAGFRNPTVSQIEQYWQLSSADDLFDAMYNSSVRNAAMLRAQRPETLEAIREAIRREVTAQKCVLPMFAVLSSAERP
jgi:ubiquinone/menaquinone biosynthesis C-methylase UbiE